MDEIRKYKPMVYICSPYAGDTEVNIANACTEVLPDGNAYGMHCHRPALLNSNKI